MTKQTYLILGVIIILLAAGALFAWQEREASVPPVIEPAPVTPVTPTPPTVAPPTTPTVPTPQTPQGWKTYQDPHGYEILYPSKDVQFEAGDGYIFVNILNSYGRMDILYRGSNSVDFSGPFENTTVNSYKALRVSEKAREEFYIYSPIGKNNVRIGIFSRDAEGNFVASHYQLFHNILATFSFIKPHEFYVTTDEVRKGKIREELIKKEEQRRLPQRAIHIKDWNVYKNEKFGFEVEYPKGWFTYDRETFLRDNGGPDFGKCGATGGIGMANTVVFSEKDLGKCVDLSLSEASLTEGIIEFNIHKRDGYFPFIYEGPGMHTVIIDGVVAKKEFFTKYLDGPRGKKIQIQGLFYQDKEYGISFPQKNTEGAYDPVFDQILSTFRFLK